MNIVGVLYGLTCVIRPSRLLPSLVIDEFSDLPHDIAGALLSKSRNAQGEKQSLDIRALVLDKDNCFAEPDSLAVAGKYLVRVKKISGQDMRANFRQDRWRLMKQQFPGDQVLIVSNSAGTLDDKMGQDVR